MFLSHYKLEEPILELLYVAKKVSTRSAKTALKESEQIWMKSGELSVHYWRLALADFGRDPRSSDSLRGSRNFVLFFCQVNNT